MNCRRILGLIALGAAVVCGAAPEAALNVLEEASPLVGTGGHGHTYPGATAPFGFVQLSPDTRTTTWEACAGYAYADTTILGFSHTHLSGTGIADLGDILVMPVVGAMEGGKEEAGAKAGAAKAGGAGEGGRGSDAAKAGGKNETGGAGGTFAAERFKSAFSHVNETAQPGYYRVALDRYGVLAELTATARVGVHRYTFPASDEAHLLVDLVHGLGNRPTDAGLKVESENLLTGYRQCTGWAKTRILYFALESSVPWKSVVLEREGSLLEEKVREAKSPKLRARLDYRTREGQQIVLRVGLSAVSAEGALRNLRREVAHWDFDAVRRSVQDDWNRQLSRIAVDTDNPGFRKTFYSALYHTMTAPTLFNDVDGAYRGADGKVHQGEGFQNYSTFSLWDTYRAEHPLLTLVQPGRVDDFVRSLLNAYRQSPDRALPMWPLQGFETGCMIGYHSAPVIADAYAKGFRGFDAALALEALTETARHGRNRQDEYQKYGYIPWVRGQKAATARTLEYSFDDWCIASMARALGRTAEADEFARRASYYRNVWDAKNRFFRSKQADGTYLEPFNPKEVSTGDVPAWSYFVEANAWQYAFAAVHDVPGMIALYGGREAFIARLDEFFDQDSDMDKWRVDVTGLSGQYAHGNEPCHHVAYLYALAGAQYKTARRVQQIMRMQYDATPDGLCGNDDCGQISAWYVFSAMGLYPANPAEGIYVIGSPLMAKTVLRLDPKFHKGETFTILAKGVSKQNIYVQRATLNGRKLERPWVTHEEITRGGTLELEMGILPVKQWGGAAP